MASLFASPDIAALVAAFPPPLPTRTQPSLVRIHSGNGLLNSRSVLDHFRILLETEPDRIKKSDLPYRLGAEKSDWLLVCYEGHPPIRWSANGASMIPRRAWEKSLEQLISLCQHDFVDLDQFAKDQDLERLSSEDLEAIKESNSLRLISPTTTNQESHSFLASDKLFAATEEQINSATQNGSGEKVDLSRLLPTIPPPVLQQLAAEKVPQDQLEVNETGVFFVPSGYEATQAQRSKASRESRLQQLMDRFENEDFVLIRPDSNDSADEDVQELVGRYTGLHINVEKPVSLDVDSTTKLVAQPGLLGRTVQELKDQVSSFILKDKDGLINTLDEELKSELATRSTDPVLSNVLLSIPSYSKPVSSAIDEAISDREHKQLQQFASEFNREVTIPLHLYANGVETIIDSKPKQNLSEYITTHFRNEVIPDFVKSYASFIPANSNKSTTREMQKFVERSNQARTINDIVNAAEKFAKKIKLASPMKEERQAVRRQILERKAFKEMPKMTRGSDVLQNLTWILLSTVTQEQTQTTPAISNMNGDTQASTTPAERPSHAGDGLTLFMSPGKDTGRMIKQYSAVAPNDTETSNKLASWRGKLKTGSETRDDLDEMRSLAQRVISNAIGDDDQCNLD